jgi:hypothetical protein
MKQTILATVLLAVTASPALAGGERDRALLAIGQAQANIQAASVAGAETRAVDAQGKANAALERARRHLAQGNENHAFYRAREADAYARLALAQVQTGGRATHTAFEGD